jgi:AcrR family transcriptional regulator
MPAAKRTEHATGAKGTTGVDPPSRYHSPLRERQAAATRRAIIDAALVLFGEQGWAATTLPMVAARAGTSVDTIYATFGTKSALLMTVVDVAIVGDDEEASMAQRPDFAQFAEGRRHERLRTGVRYTMDVYARSVPILDALREAAASDPAAEERLARYGQDRRDLIAAGMALILGEEPSGDVVDAIWALVSPEVYTHLIHGRRWPAPQVEDWFVDMAKAAIARAGRS